MRTGIHTLILLFILCGWYIGDARGQANTAPASTPPQEKQMDMGAMEKRGDHVMGFDHAKTTHHFILNKEGGIIQVEANDGNDAASRDKIRMHLSHIAEMFSEGNFRAPMLIHAQTPPGVNEMKAAKGKINYKFEETDKGGRVLIKTNDEKALNAVYEFLRFQIKEHRTGDPVEVQVTNN